ncbi:hypothetical protein JRQ81_009751 [Phrynocephalus forsythii]|uniref:Integrator complex subunit 11 n=1 Tax=Phrynocephalus forsythii TaxID=171643 RepID=A0A9Q0X958_9SAUR|nr:hypothetical protein JRQ81_009751 [Phrynocephalus forsythii]
MSFSAHADAKGIMQLIRQAEPRNVLLVHGEAKKMEFLKQKIEQEFHVNCHMPANGETVTIFTNPNIPVDISLGLLKRELTVGPTPDSKRPKLMHGTLIIKDNVSDAACALISQPRSGCCGRLWLSRPGVGGVLKDYSVQHLSDTSIMVESILIQVTVQSEDPATKLLLVSWTYQLAHKLAGISPAEEGSKKRKSAAEILSEVTPGESGVRCRHGVGVRLSRPAFSARFTLLLRRWDGSCTSPCSRGIGGADPDGIARTPHAEEVFCSHSFHLPALSAHP